MSIATKELGTGNSTRQASANSLKQRTTFEPSEPLPSLRLLIQGGKLVLEPEVAQQTHRIPETSIQSPGNSGQRDTGHRQRKIGHIRQIPYQGQAARKTEQQGNSRGSSTNPHPSSGTWIHGINRAQPISAPGAILAEASLSSWAGAQSRTCVSIVRPRGPTRAEGLSQLEDLALGRGRKWTSENTGHCTPRDALGRGAGKAGMPQNKSCPWGLSP